MTIDGRKISEQLQEEISKRVKDLSFTPILCDIIVGNDAVSFSYVRIKQRAAEKCGFEFQAIALPEDSTEAEVIAAIEKAQAQERLCGLIVQLPLPKHLNDNEILSAINPAVDVDVINPVTPGQFVSPTPAAILHILDSLMLDLTVEKFLVLGQGNLVGKPVAESLQARGYDVTVADENTPNTNELMKEASVIISGVGKPKLITGRKVKDNVIVIDAGTSESDGTIVGDVDFESVSAKARFVTPSPGGVGPITVAKLLENTLISAERH